MLFALLLTAALSAPIDENQPSWKVTQCKPVSDFNPPSIDNDQRNMDFYNLWYYSQGVVAIPGASHAPVELCRTDRAGKLQFVADLPYSRHTVVSISRENIFYKLFAKSDAGPCTGKGLTAFTEFSKNANEMNTLEMRSICTPSDVPPFLCMTDNESDRTFPDYLSDSSLLLQDPNMSIQQCQSHCASKNYAMSGLQNGNSCFCGKSFQALGRWKLSVPVEQCNKKCPTGVGNCGTEGSSLIQVYRSGFVEPIPNSICLQDNPASPIFPDVQNDPVLQDWGMSVELCRNVCKTKKYAFAGLQDARTCSCGNYPQIKGPSVPIEQCDRGCNWGAGKCGTTGNALLQAYPSGLDDPAPQSLGCFQDSETRVFNDPQVYYEPTMNLARCISSCKDRGLPYAGLEASQYCFCGSEEEKNKLTAIGSENCGACPLGGGSCGGNWALAVYPTGAVGKSCDQDTDCGANNYCAKFDDTKPGICRSKTCMADSECLSGLTCLKPGDATTGVCGVSDAVEDFLTSDIVQQQTRRMLVTDDTAWTEGDNRTVIRQVLMAHMLAPLANDAYSNPPNSTIGNWKALTPAITSDFTAVMVNWGWLSFTIYGDERNNRYTIAFKGTDLTKINEVLTDLTGTLVPCKFGNTDCGKYHHGFHDAYESLRLKLYQAVKDAKIPPSATIFITGHSLGGALASICALDLASGGINVRGIITFGSPRLGNAQFETVYNNVMTQRGALQARFAAVDTSKTHQDMVTMLAPLPVELPILGKVGLPYERPVNNIIVGASPACNGVPVGCELALHFMSSSYIPMIQGLYDAAMKKIE